jgi:hypothetical protein
VKGITIKDRALFEKYLRQEEHELAEYAFQDIYIWKRLFDIRWSIIRGCLCVFFSDSCGSFLYLPPLGPCSPEAVKDAFALLGSLNTNPAFSRIENVEERELSFFSRLGYRHSLRGHEYICSREEMASLKGDRFKSKRASVNYFAGHNRFEYMPFSAAHADGCFGLYKEWMAERAAGSAGKHDSVYRGMLADGLSCLDTMLGDYERLGMEGAVLFSGGHMAAFTFGYPLTAPPEAEFCVLFEVAHPRFKGAAQFIFRNFCAGQAGYETVNVMDDSGLENLKRVKMSYRPRRLAPAYIINAL